MHIIRPQPHPEADKCTPNILPCRINHNGPVNASKRYWEPEVDAAGKPTAYLRGRKLHGRNVTLPQGYKGVILRATDQPLRQKNNTDARRTGDAHAAAAGFAVGEEDSSDGDGEPVKVLEEAASFEEMVVWGHEVLPGADDPYVKGVEEWIALAEAMHSTGCDGWGTACGKEA